VRYGCGDAGLGLIPDVACPLPAVYPVIHNFMEGKVGEQASGGIAAAAGRDCGTEVAPML